MQMDFETLDRSYEEYHWVLRTWLETPGLTIPESSLVQTLLKGLENSIENFDQLRRIAVQPGFLPILRSAARKAMASGRLTSWSQYAQET